MNFMSRERDCELTFAVVTKNFGDPVKLRYKTARKLAKVVKMAFGPGAEVYIGTKDGNHITWSEEKEIWPKGE
jgi:ribosomal protein S4E